MASILPGFEYDIFISYRHNDNKSGWVTDFVNALQEELAATIKEPLSIYFDKNPQDGLSAHHDVDESLRGKIQCLVFIPIVSRTYCDLNSFAWKYEFCAFVEQAKNDAISLKVKLRSGNVTSRVLPVRIHELDKSDTSLFESVSGGVLRPIDFVYKSSGVNRPLTPNDDQVREQGRLLYRDQINKVANAISEIISGLKHTNAHTGAQYLEVAVPPIQEKSSRSWRTPALVTVLVGLCALAVFYFLQPPSLKLAAESGLAIMPFTNNTGRTDLDFLSVGMASEIRNRISMSKQFEFISALQATLPYLKEPKPPKEVGSELAVDYILTGIYQADDNRIRVEAEFLDAKTGRLIWSLPVETELAGIFEMQGEIASEVIKKFSPDGQLADETGGTTNLEAYAAYWEGERISLESDQDSVLNKAIEKLKQAITLDSAYALAWAALIQIETESYAEGYSSADRLPRITQDIAYVRLHFPSNWVSDLADGLYFYRIAGNFDLALQSFNRVLEKDPDNARAIGMISAIYKRKLEHEKSLKWRRKAIQLQPKAGLQWLEVGLVFKFMGDSKHALQASLKRWDLQKNEDAAMNVLWFTAAAGFHFDQLPKELLKKAGTWPDIFKAHLNSDWKSLLTAARSAKSPFHIAAAFHFLHRPDSARYWAEKGLQKEPGDWILLAIAGEREKAIQSLDDQYEPSLRSGNDLMQQCNKMVEQISIMVTLKDYKEATHLLKKLNDDFPEYQAFEHFFRFGWFSGIRRDYPPFNEALKNLKRRPAPDVSQYIKFD